MGNTTPNPEQLLFVNIANSADELNEVLSINGQDFMT